MLSGAKKGDDLSTLRDAGVDREAAREVRVAAASPGTVADAAAPAC
jgi:hypothetical protein